MTKMTRILTVTCVFLTAPLHAAEADQSYKIPLSLRPKKHPRDPCPEGLWWHVSHNLCFPLVCTMIPNDKQLSSTCPRHHHPHKKTIPPGDDGGHPISCPQDYSDANLGRTLKPDDCPICTDKSHEHTRMGAPMKVPRIAPTEPPPEETTVTAKELKAGRKNGIEIIDRYNPGIMKGSIGTDGKKTKKSRRVKLMNGVYVVIPPEGLK